MPNCTTPTAHGTEKSDNLQPVMQIIAQSPLQKLVEKARLLIALDDHIHKHLPTQFAGLCRVANIQDNTVIILTQSAAIATRLRFMTDDILKGIREAGQFKRVQKISVKVFSSSSR